MNYFEKMLLTYLWDGQLEMKITGFDLDGFQKAIEDKARRRLEMIESIAFADGHIVSDAEKVESIKLLFRREFYDGE